MSYVLVHHKVEDYDRWKAGFDATEADRRESGSKGGYVLRKTGDPNDVWVMLEWEDAESFREFIEAEDMKKTMKDAGVLGELEIEYLEEAARPSI